MFEAAVYCEKLSDWRFLIATVNAFVEISRRLQGRESGPPELWDWLLSYFRCLEGDTDAEETIEEGLSWSYGTRAAELGISATLDEERRDFAFVLNAAIQAGSAGPEVVWQPEHERAPELHIGSWSLYGSLMLQLAIRCCASVGLMVCDGCGTEYARRAKRPKPGENNFCPECRARGVPAKLAQRAYRASNPPPPRKGKRGRRPHGKTPR